ncbi:MAG: polysaccharide export protein [Syntrophobacteraceae bacterium CG07_land_8_20_14_0_80_61_8]|nr:MAG: polysaccharide export protein [Syntrophobacteraceae bacterium CG07_land_8_20_14_0_80_61_8]
MKTLIRACSLVFVMLICRPPLLWAAAEQPYIIGTGDVLSVIIFAGGTSQQSLDVTVASDGTVNFPFLGKVKAAGLSLVDFTQAVTAPLSRDYFVSPQVIVNIKDYKSKQVYVTGAIQKPGLYNLEKDPTVLAVIAMAGGVTKERGRYAHVIRGSIDKLQGQDIAKLVNEGESVRVDLQRLLEQGDTLENIRLTPGDVVYFSPTNFSDLTEYKVYVMGKVEKPGVYDFQQGLTALDACILAGGFAKYAAPNRTVITRRQPGQDQESIAVNLDNVRKGSDKDVPLKPGDRIYVPESWF